MMRTLLLVTLAGMIVLALARSARAQEALPAAPTDLVAGPYGPTNVVLFWYDSPDDEDAYRIERSASGENGPWTLVSQVPNECPVPTGRQCAYVDRNLAYETTYWYRVAAVNSAGVSAYSNVASAETLPRPTPAPGTIRGFAFHDRNGDGVQGEGEPGLSGRQVELFRGEERLRTSTSGSPYGGYLFHGISPGDYTVVAADLDQRWAQGCSTSEFSFNPLQLGHCVSPVFPWNPTSARSVDVTVDGGVTVDFGARPADVAVLVGHAILELDLAPAGTEIVAFVNGQECGSATVSGGSTGEFMIHVLGAGERAGCARPGDRVQYTAGGIPAAGAGRWVSFSDPSNLGQVNFHNLVAMQQHAWYWFQTSFEFSGEEPPAAGTRVQAVIGGVVCGEATILRSPDGRLAGFSRLIVPSAELQAGCGHAGESVSFLFDGVATGEPIEWRAGLQYINPLVGPVILPTSGSGPSSGRGVMWPPLLGLAAAAAFLLAGGRLLAARRR